MAHDAKTKLKHAKFNAEVERRRILNRAQQLINDAAGVGMVLTIDTINVGHRMGSHVQVPSVRYSRGTYQYIDALEELAKESENGN